MRDSNPSKEAIRKRAVYELKEFAIIAAYLYVCFTAILYFKAAILLAHGIQFAPFGLAAVKALICAKFVSIGNVFRVGERFRSMPLIWSTLYKSFTFLILLLVLNSLEEIAVGLIHHRPIADIWAEFGGDTIQQVIATSIIGLLILIPFFAFRAIAEVVGETDLVRMFFQPQPSAGHS
jgi:hypothetical protein